jgi:transcription elongation factor SPT5
MLIDGSSKAIIQAVPRPDYAKEKSLPGSGVAVRPPQMLFNPEEAKAQRQGGSSDVAFKRMPMIQELMCFWNNEFYRDGFLMKEVSVSSYIDAENVKPTIEEISMFKDRKSSNSEYDDGDDAENKTESIAGASESLLDDIMDMQSGITTSAPIPFVIGDMVQVISGELKQLIGRIISIDEAAKLIKIAPMHSDMSTEIIVEASLLVKHIKPGAHVKVIEGAFDGQTGKVVCITAIDNSHVATILTDGVNSEISVNVSHLQATNEIATGLSNLMGYELYDLVLMNANETAVVVFVGSEMLTVINQAGVSKRVLPIDLKGKKNSQSQRTTAFDASHNNINVTDTVKVTEGPHKNKSGTIKHIFKSVLWLHSNSHLKDSG